MCLIHTTISGYETDYIVLYCCSNGFQILFCALTSCLHRDALLSCFPGIQHLMCFFHSKQACQKQLCGKPMRDQKEMLKDITELHSSASYDENNSLYCRVFAKWCIDYNDFVYYFEQQWNTGTEFTNWKVFSCEPGVCTTNNALESFDVMFQCSYTNHSHHTLPSLLDIIMVALIVDLSSFPYQVYT